ncbi:peptidylprolyl isomerase [Thiohalomonas denitrificans]|uniref:peptidylprolyl isomerase n=1 Tax=Thiohalomonas denitrificans TaxID=415747 RepID=UPI0026EAEF3A|nr:peptidylprolyl isomerase [Thiohalomonas denitrificans]
MMDIVVNGRTISEADIHREMQYHPAGSAAEAREAASRALGIRELLLDEAARLEIETCPEPGEEDEEARIRSLIEQEVKTPEPDIESCRRYYENNRQQLRSPWLHEVSHIFLPVPEEPVARGQTEQQARELIAELGDDVHRFADLAQRYSACPSRESGGSLGVLGPGQTPPEFERALARFTPGGIAPAPVETRYGYHVVYLQSRQGGHLYSFEEAQPLVADYLRESLFRRALLEYVQSLASRAEIKGVDLECAGEGTPMDCGV